MHHRWPHQQSEIWETRKTKPIDNTANTALGHKTAFRIRETKQIKINYSVIEEKSQIELWE